MSATNGFNPLHAAAWERWDSGHYLFIAAHGYDAYPCPARLHGFNYAPGTWCGHTGWFPAYPWLIGALQRFGLPPAAVGVAISWLFALGTLLLLWTTFLRRTLTIGAIGCLLFAAYVPGQVYHYAIFPLSMLAFLTVLNLWLLDSERWLLAGLAGAGAAMTYPIGVMLAPVSALWIVFVVVETPWAERLRRVALASGVAAAGFGLVLLDMQLETGHWDAYFKIQAKYGHGFHDPISTFRNAIDPALHGSLLKLAAVPAVQTIFVGAVVGFVAVEAARNWRRLPVRDSLLLLWAAAFFLFPVTQANVELYRSQATLLPIGVLLLQLPRALLFLLAGAALWLSAPMAQLFFQSVLT